MRAHLLNATCGVLDYVAYPAAMLLVAPLILRHRGPAEFGIWAVATAVVSTGAILASGFGDAGIQAVAAARGRVETEQVVMTVRAMMSVHLVLGGFAAAGVLLLSHVTGDALAPNEDARIRTCGATAFRCASCLLLLRAVEAVCVATQRAFERYAAALVVSGAGRLASLTVAAVCAIAGRSVAAMLGAMLLVQAASVALQLLAVARRIGWRAVIPSCALRDVSTILRDGRYTWLIAAAGVLFAYADRMLIGFSRGAESAAAYALCVQLAQPVYGLVANGLHFLFPYFARVSESMDTASFAQVVRRAAGLNAALAVGLSVVAGLAGRPALRMLSGGKLNTNGALLAMVVASFGLLSASVVATYALVAMRRARTVALAFSEGAIVMCGLMPGMLHRWGAEGLAGARLIFGAVCLLLYMPLFEAIQKPSKKSVSDPLSAVWVRGIEGDVS